MSLYKLLNFYMDKINDCMYILYEGEFDKCGAILTGRFDLHSKYRELSSNSPTVR